MRKTKVLPWAARINDDDRLVHEGSRLREAVGEAIQEWQEWCDCEGSEFLETVEVEIWQDAVVCLTPDDPDEECECGGPHGDGLDEWEWVLFDWKRHRVITVSVDWSDYLEGDDA